MGKKDRNQQRTLEGGLTVRVNTSKLYEDILDRALREALFRRDYPHLERQGQGDPFSMFAGTERPDPMLIPTEIERDARTNDTGPLMTTAVLFEQGERANRQGAREELIVVEQRGEEVRWLLNDLYHVNTVTGEVQYVKGFPVPKTGEKDAASRWYITDKNQVYNDRIPHLGSLVFATIEEVQDYLTEWTVTYRKRIAKVHGWLAAEVKRGGEDREPRQK